MARETVCPACGEEFPSLIGLTNHKCTYQGWVNPQTWCVWCVFNNTQDNQKRALNACRDVVTPFGAGVLHTIAEKMRAEIVAFAPWAWPDGWDYRPIDFLELEKAFKRKISEGC